MAIQTTDHTFLSDLFASLSPFTFSFASLFSFRCILPLLVVYPFLCRIFRYRRAFLTVAKYPPSALSSMTLEDATAIQMQLAQYEFPFTFEKSLEYALFRTYGIPTISSLLEHTSQFANPVTACKRYVDTATLIREFTSAGWGSQRWSESVARMNCLHAVYQNDGKISNDDMLYTLSLFAWEPIRWIERWEWRPLTDAEKCALGVFWMGMGDAMGVSYHGLQGYTKGTGWKDALQWLQEVGLWAETYETRVMRPTKSNSLVADETVDILLYNIPGKWAKSWGKKAISCLMTKRVSRAMMFDDPPPWLETTVRRTLSLRRVLLRHLALPRLLPLVKLSKYPSRQGTYYITKYHALPYYVEPTLWNRWGPSSWWHRIIGVPLPGDNGKTFHPEGFTSGMIGPRIAKNGLGDMQEKLVDVGGLVCPVGLGAK